LEGSTANLRIVVVPPTVADSVVTTMAVMLGPTRREVPGTGPFELAMVDAPSVATVQLVSAPDAVVTVLGGAFADMTTMAEVRTAHRDVTSVFDHHHWTVKAHKHRLCTSSQQACVRTVMLVAARLHAQWTPNARLARVCAVAVGQLQLLALPDEIWQEVLGWLRRTELGTLARAPPRAVRCCCHE
jgi:hypothetical protein